MNVGVTSGGDLFGGTQVTFSDVLGDKQFNLFASSVAQYRTMSFSYLNLSRRLQYALQAYSQTQFYYGYDPGLLYGSEYAYLSRDQAIATQTARGVTAFGIYPFNRYARIELSGGIFQYNQAYNDAGEDGPISTRSIDGRPLFSPHFMPIGISYVHETPSSANTCRRREHVRVGYEYAQQLGATVRHTRTSIGAVIIGSPQTACSRSRPLVQELGRVPRLLFRRQFGTARLRLPRVPRQ